MLNFIDKKPRDALLDTNNMKSLLKLFLNCRNFERILVNIGWRARALHPGAAEAGDGRGRSRGSDCDRSDPPGSFDSDLATSAIRDTD